MRILKTNGFTKFAKKERITDRMLRDTVKEIANGLKGSPQGSSVYKQRVARPGKGKSGGFRTMIVFRKEIGSSSLKDMPRTSNQRSVQWN